MYSQNIQICRQDKVFRRRKQFGMIELVGEVQILLYLTNQPTNPDPDGGVRLAKLSTWV